MSSPSPENLRLRIQLIAKFDQLQSRLSNGDESAIEEAHSHICGLIVCRDMPTLSLIMKALGTVLTDMQDELDSEKQHW